MTTKSTLRILASALLCVLGFLISLNSAAVNEQFSPYVSSDGKINFPEGFSVSMVHLGSWFVPKGVASGFHNVYTEPESIEHFRKTGKFPDGATIIKELRASAKGNYTMGSGVHYSTSEIKLWFVMIKDGKGRFPNSDLWGDGWGWALFKPGKKKTNIAYNYKIECLGCHYPAEQNGWIYTEGYPALMESG